MMQLFFKVLLVILTLMLRPMNFISEDYEFSGRIVFNSDRDGDSEIYSMNVDGSDLEQLTNNDFPDYRPEWSPDGTQIVFISARYEVYEYVGPPSSEYEIYIMNADGTNVRQLTSDNFADFSASWSPDGDSIVFHSFREGDFEVYRMSTDGSNQHQLTDNDAPDGSPAWSPDGTQIAFVSRRIGDNTIFVMDADGSNVVQLTDETIFSDRPVWSPDGTQIAYYSLKDGEYQIMIMDADGSNIRQLTTEPNQRGALPAWSPEGNYIMYVCTIRRDQSSEYFDSEICVVDIMNLDTWQLTDNDANESWIDWILLD